MIADFWYNEKMFVKRELSNQSAKDQQESGDIAKAAGTTKLNQQANLHHSAKWAEN